MKKFEQVYQDMKIHISDGTYKVDSFMPNENDLALKYNVSRGTIRAAQKLLQDEGSIKKVHGRGAKVLDLQKFNIDTKIMTRFSDLLGVHKGAFETKVLSNRPSYLTKSDFGYDEVKNRPGILVERLRLYHGEAVIFDRDFFLTEEIGEQIPEDYLSNSIYEYLEKVRKLKIDFAQKDITLEKPTEDQKLLLALHNDSHLVVTRSRVYLYNTHLFQIHESFQRADTFHLSDMAKR